MPFDMLTPFGVRPGQVTDEERLNASMGDAAANRAAAQAELAARLGIAKMGSDTQRYGIDKQLEGTGTFAQRSTQEGSMFDRGAQLSRDLDKSATERAFGTVDRQMGPAMMREGREQTLFNEGTSLRQARNGMQMGAMESLKAAMGGGSSGAKISPEQFDLMSLQAAIANGGAIPDVSGRSSDRALRDMQLSELKRQQAYAQVKQMVDSGDWSGAEAFAKANGVSVPRRDYGDTQKMIAGEVDRVKNFIRSNNWSIAGNKADLDRLYQQTLQRLQALHPSPEAQTLIEQDLKNAMRDALKENGVIFESAGSDAVRENYGL